MIYFLALLPATVLTVAGYLVLYVSNRSEGSFRSFGKYLGFWAFTLAGLVILGAIFCAAQGGHHRGMMMLMSRQGPGAMMHGGPGNAMYYAPCGEPGQMPPPGAPPPVAVPPNAAAPSQR
jgi:hypothetical protein